MSIDGWGETKIAVVRCGKCADVVGKAYTNSSGGAYFSRWRPRDMRHPSLKSTSAPTPGSDDCDHWFNLPVDRLQRALRKFNATGQTSTLKTTGDAPTT